MGWVYRVEGERTMGALACAFSWDTLPSTVLAATGTRAMQAIVESSCWGWGGGGGECGGVSSANFRVSYPKLPGRYSPREGSRTQAPWRSRAWAETCRRPCQGCLSHSGGFGLREVRCLRAPVVAVAGACTAPNPTRAGAMTAVRPGSLCPDTCRRAELQAPCPAIPPARS
jgi:hypothetical protein